MKTYTYNFPKPSVTTDCIITRFVDGKREVLLIQRKFDPFKDTWALPGGFVESEEDLLEGAQRELMEETGISDLPLEQFRTYGTPGRDPRGRTISIVYSGELMDNTIKIQANDDASKAGWFDADHLPPLAFDHNTILNEYFGHQKNNPD